HMLLLCVGPADRNGAHQARTIAAIACRMLNRELIDGIEISEPGRTANEQRAVARTKDRTGRRWISAPGKDRHRSRRSDVTLERGRSCSIENGNERIIR